MESNHRGPGERSGAAPQKPANHQAVVGGSGHGGDFRKLVTGGDDYVVLFTASADARDALQATDPDRSLRLTRIGRVEAGEGVALVDWNGVAIAVPETGYSHELGR